MIMPTTIGSPLTLRSGLTVFNRLAKAATSEKLANARDDASAGLATLYERWGRGGAGLAITGNVIVERGGREGRGNVVVEDDSGLPALRAWAERAQAAGMPLLVQLNHAGRQAPLSVARRPVAPSAVPLAGFAGLAARPRALDDREIEVLIERFAFAAAVLQRAGFAGVQLHAAHGYLLSQFLSPLTNRRTDRWGGSLDNRMRLLLATLRAVRAATAPGFTVGVKLNSADFQRGGFTEDESMRVVETLDGDGVDFIEVSGGTYEAIAMFGHGEQRASTRAREAYFLDYVERVRARIRTPLMLTGGFRTAAAMNEAVGAGAVDLVGLARPLIVEPDLPARLLDGTAAGARPVDLRSRVRRLENLFEATWYGRQLRRMAAGRSPDPTLSRWLAAALEAPRAYAYNPLRLLLPDKRAPIPALPQGATQS